MHPRFRKLALVVATVGLVVSLFVALRPDGDEGDGAVAQTTEARPQTTTAPATTDAPPATTEAPPATTTVAPVERPAVVRIRVVGGRPEGGIRRASVRRGKEVTIRVTADVSDHIHLHGYDLMADVAPGSPARIRFKATVPGRFEVELEDRGVQIADLQVLP